MTMSKELVMCKLRRESGATKGYSGRCRLRRGDIVKFSFEGHVIVGVLFGASKDRQWKRIFGRDAVYLQSVLWCSMSGWRELYRRHERPLNRYRHWVPVGDVVLVKRQSKRLSKKELFLLGV